jgi:hypothetical protein
VTPLLLTIAGDVAVIGAALVTTTLVLVYARSRFEESQVGRQFMWTKLCLALILDYGAILSLPRLGEPLDRGVGTLTIRLLIFALIAFIMMRWLIIVVKIQIDERKQYGKVR